MTIGSRLVFLGVLLGVRGLFGEGQEMPHAERLRALRNDLEKAEPRDREPMADQCLAVLKAWLDSADAKERLREDAPQHLLEYAEIRDVAASLRQNLSTGPQEEVHLRLSSELTDRVRRWSAPDAYYADMMATAKELWSEKHFLAAADHLRRAASVAPANSRADAVFLEAVAILAAGGMMQGKGLLEGYIQDFPGSKRRHAARYLLAHIYWLTLDYAKAADAFRAVAGDDPTSGYGRESERLHRGLKEASEIFFFTYR